MSRVNFSVFVSDKKVSLGLHDSKTTENISLEISADGKVRSAYILKDPPTFTGADIRAECEIPVERFAKLFATASGVKMLQVEYPDEHVKFTYVGGAEPILTEEVETHSGVAKIEVMRGFDAVETAFVLLDKILERELDELERLHARPEETKITAVVQEPNGDSTVFTLKQDKEFRWFVAIERGEGDVETYHASETATEKAHKILNSLLKSVRENYDIFYPVQRGEKNEIETHHGVSRKKNRNPEMPRM